MNGKGKGKRMAVCFMVTALSVCAVPRITATASEPAAPGNEGGYVIDKNTVVDVLNDGNVTNYGTVNNNGTNGVIVLNDGTVKVNNGTVSRNGSDTGAAVNSVIEKNASGGVVVYNYGHGGSNYGGVRLNEGRVTNNYGLVVTNAEGGVIENNFGLVTANNGVIVNNYGGSIGDASASGTIGEVTNFFYNFIATGGGGRYTLSFDNSEIIPVKDGSGETLYFIKAGSTVSFRVVPNAGYRVESCVLEESGTSTLTQSGNTYTLNVAEKPGTSAYSGKIEVNIYTTERTASQGNTGSGGSGNSAPDPGNSSSVNTDDGSPDAETGSTGTDDKGTEEELTIPDPAGGENAEPVKVTLYDKKTVDFSDLMKISDMLTTKDGVSDGTGIGLTYDFTGLTREEAITSVAMSTEVMDAIAQALTSEEGNRSLSFIMGNGVSVTINEENIRQLAEKAKKNEKKVNMIYKTEVEKTPDTTELIAMIEESEKNGDSFAARHVEASDIVITLVFREEGKKVQFEEKVEDRNLPVPKPFVKSAGRNGSQGAYTSVNTGGSGNRRYAAAENVKTLENTPTEIEFNYWFDPADRIAEGIMKMGAGNAGIVQKSAGETGESAPGIKESTVNIVHVIGDARPNIRYSITEGEAHYDECDRGDGCVLRDFNDAVKTGWYHDCLHFMVQYGNMKGVGENELAPDREITRGEFVTLLYRSLRQQADEGRITFNDVSSGSFYREAVLWASANGIVSGYDKNTFGPDDIITREQMAVMFFRTAKYLTGGEVKVGDMSSMSLYADADEISPFAGDAVAFVVNTGWMKGDRTGALRPLGAVTRAEASAIIQRMFETAGLR